MLMDVLQWKISLVDLRPVARTKPAQTPERTELAELLTKAFALKNFSLNDTAGKEFVDQSRLFLLKQWVKEDPTTQQLPDGSSILVAMFALSPAQALDWWKEHGSECWKPTKQTPFPLRSVLRALQKKAQSWGEAKELIFQWPKELVPRRQEVEKFLEDGLRHAMPLRSADLPDMASRTFHDEAWQAQLVVSRFLTEDCSLFSAQAKTPWLAENDGVLMSDGDFFLRWVDNPFFKPTTQVWHKPPYSANHVQQDSLLDLWQIHREKLEDKFHPWLEKHGVNTLGFRQNLLVRQVAKAGDWETVKKAAESLEGGWSHQRDGQIFLTWQSCLCAHPELLQELVQNPPTQAVLKKTSDAGLGIWSAFFDGMGKIDGYGKPIQWPNYEAVKGLHRLTPLKLGQGDYLDMPLLYRTREESPSWMHEFFQSTFHEAPEAWVGLADENQAIQASALIVNLLVKQRTNAREREESAKQLNMLAKVANILPEALSPQTHALLWFAHKFVSGPHHKTKTAMESLMGHTWPEPSIELLGWVGPMMASIPKPEETHPTLLALKSLAKWSVLTQALGEGMETRARARL